MNPEESTAVEPPPDALSRAGDRIRETAKWLTISLVVIGGVLTAGIQFSNIGSLNPESARFDIAIIGVALALVGTAVILAGTVWTATTPAVSLNTLEASPRLDDPILLQGVQNVDALRKTYRKALIERREAREENLKDPTETTRNKAKIADTNLFLFDEIVRNVLSVASYDRLTSRWRQSAVAIFLGSLVAVSGIISFIWATTPPSQENLASISGATIQNLERASIILTENGQDLLAPVLGQACRVDEPMEGVVLQKSEAGVETIIEDDGCTPVRLLISPEWGIARSP